MKNIKKTFAVKLAAMALMAATLAPTCAAPVMAATRNEIVTGLRIDRDSRSRPLMETENGIVLGSTFAHYRF